MAESCVAAFDFVIFYGDEEGLFGSDEDIEFFSAGDSGVEQIALEELVVGGVDGHDDAGAFAALVFVYGYGVSEDEFVEIGEVVEDFASVDVDFEFLVDGVDFCDIADVAVEDLSFVVVA